MNRAIWEYIKNLRPDPPRVVVRGRFTVVSPSTVARREKQGRKGLATHEKLTPWPEKHQTAA